MNLIEKKLRRIAKAGIRRLNRPYRFRYEVPNDERWQRRAYRILSEYRIIDEDKLTMTLEVFGKNIILRKFSTDVSVFEQIICEQEYLSVVNCLRANAINPSVIFDLGSNIGLTSFYFHHHFPQAKFFALEPDQANFELAARNLADLTASKTVELLNKAVWSRDCELFVHDGGGDWARHASIEDNGIKTQGISLPTLIADKNIDTIDVLKIDIEGGEFELFGEDNDLGFLGRTKVIALEIHDKLGDRSGIYGKLRSTFCLYEVGELTVGINRHLVA